MFSSLLGGWRPRLGNPGSTTGVLKISVNFHELEFPALESWRNKLVMGDFFRFLTDDFPACEAKFPSNFSY